MSTLNLTLDDWPNVSGFGGRLVIHTDTQVFGMDCSVETLKSLERACREIRESLAESQWEERSGALVGEA